MLPKNKRLARANNLKRRDRPPPPVLSYYYCYSPHYWWSDRFLLVAQFPGPDDFKKDGKKKPRFDDEMLRLTAETRRVDIYIKNHLKP